MKKLVTVAILFSLLLSLAGPAFADTQYVVQPRDTLFRIALHFGATVSALAQANHITNPNRIFVGQVLTIPGPKPTGQLTRYVVRRGDTLWRIAHIFGTSVAAIQAANRLSSALIFAGQVLLVPIK
jgi:LysM repeat protein